MRIVFSWVKDFEFISFWKKNKFILFSGKIKEFFTDKISVWVFGTLKTAFFLLLVFFRMFALEFLLIFSNFVFKNDSKEFLHSRSWNWIFSVGSNWVFCLFLDPTPEEARGGPLGGPPPLLCPPFVPQWNFVEMAKRDRGRTPTVPLLSSSIPPRGGDYFFSCCVFPHLLISVF